MAKQSQRRRKAAPKRAAQRQQAEFTPERTVAVLHETAKASNPFEPMGLWMQAFMPFAWFRSWMQMPQTPKLDVIDRNGSVLVRAEVPGMQKGRLEVEASDTAVTIKGEASQAGTREEAGAFERTVRMPTDVDGTKAKATFKDGVLEVKLPKVDRSRAHQVKL